MPDRRAHVLVIGAGLAGLLAARSLTRAGHDVTVVDKGRGVGGRLATRRLGGARLDHGAQFFTVRSAEFRVVADEWRTAGVVREWCRGFRQPADGHPRYVGASGMTDLAKALAAGLDVQTSTRLAAVVPGADGGWSATLEGGGFLADSHGGALRADAVVCTPPAPQSIELLAGVDVAPGAAAALARIRFDPTLAALVVLDGDGAVPAPGGVQIEEGLLSWVGDNRAKGISDVPALTLHARGDRSAERWDIPPEVALDELVRAGSPWIGDASVVRADAARWLYAAPTALHDGRCLVAIDGPRPIVCAGDAFGEPRVEGAARSGLAAAEAVIERIA
jgi:renalase